MEPKGRSLLSAPPGARVTYKTLALVQIAVQEHLPGEPRLGYHLPK